MFELKKGMKIVQFKEEYKNIEWYFLKQVEYEGESYKQCTENIEKAEEEFVKNIYLHEKDIDWNETAKLNRIDLDFIERNGKVLNEIEQQNKNTLSVTDLKQKKEKFKKEELGRKENKGKIRPNLLPITELKEVIRVFEFGVDKYSINNWKHVKDPINEYSNALSRHLLDYLEGEKKASDSNLPHLAHICANALILMWFENNKEE